MVTVPGANARCETTVGLLLDSTVVIVQVRVTGVIFIQRFSKLPAEPEFTENCILMASLALALAVMNPATEH